MSLFLSNTLNVLNPLYSKSLIFKCSSLFYHLEKEKTSGLKKNIINNKLIMVKKWKNNPSLKNNKKNQRTRIGKKNENHVQNNTRLRRM